MTYIMKRRLTCAAAAVVFALGGCGSSQEAPVSSSTDAPANAAPSDLARRTARFAPTDVTADLSKLTADEKTVLTKLVQASKIVDALFLQQVWSGNETMLLNLVRDTTPAGRDRLHAFLVNKGPWSRLDHNEPFIPGAPPKPAGANFYPDDAAKEEVEKWIQGLPT